MLYCSINEDTRDDDFQYLNEEVTELYKEHGKNVTDSVIILIFYIYSS